LEIELLLTVRAASDAELARKVRALRELAQEATEDPTAGGVDQPPTPTPASRPGGLIEIGESAVKRGEAVAVEIRGHCDVAVMGFAAAIGYQSQELEFVRIDWPALWGIADGAEVLLAEARDWDDPRAGNAGACVLLNIARFDIRSTRPGATGPEAGTNLDPVILPQGSLLATLHFKVKATAKAGKVLRLLNWSRAFGRPKLITEYTTLDLSQPSHRTMGPSVEPELEDGAIVVTG